MMKVFLALQYFRLERLRVVAFLPIALGIYFSFGYVDSGAGVAETARAALSLLHLGYMGDPYALPTGPTAHVSPTNTIIIAAVFKVFGDASAASRITLSLICSLLYGVGAYFTIRICEICKVSTLAALPTIVLTSLLPISLYDLVVYWKYWDQPFGATILCVGLYNLLAALQQDRASYASMIVLGFLTGLGAVTSPVVVPPLLIGLAVLAWTQPGWAQKANVLILGMAIASLLIIPWAVRNQMVLGKPIVTRSNFGLEFVIGNHDGAMEPGDTFFFSVHPMSSDAASRQLAEIGEVAYMTTMWELGAQWVRANPTKALGLTLRRAALAIFPDREMVGWFPLVGSGFVIAWWLAYSVLKVWALLRIAVFGPRRIVWLAFVAFPVVPYVITHVELRYLYVSFFPSAALIAVALSGIGKHRRSDRVGDRRQIRVEI